MNEQEFDFTNVKPLEPSGKLKFSSPEQLEKHILKHVIDRRKEEKWRLLPGFNAVLIRAVKPDDSLSESAELQALAWQYLDTISECANQACSEGRDHLHQLAFYPKLTMKVLGLDDPELVQYVKILGFSKKIVIILASFVRNGIPKRYKIMTAFRVFPELDGNAWKKQGMKALKEDVDLRKGKRYILLADHMQPNTNPEINEV